MDCKQLLYNSEENLMYSESQINNDWFLGQLKSFLRVEDYDNFVHKNITIEDLDEDTLFVAKFMLLNSSPSKICSQTGYFTSAIHAIIGLYNKFGNLLYDYKKCFLIRDIQILIKDIPVDEMEDTIQKLPSLFAYEYAIFTYIMDENRNGISIPRYMGIEGYFQFVIEDEKEGKNALENGWRNSKLWKLYRRLEVQGKLPVYKDKEVEENLWYAKKRPDWLYKDLDAVETISPMDETIAKNMKEDPNFIACWIESEGSSNNEPLDMFGIDRNRFYFYAVGSEGGETAMDYIITFAKQGVDMIVINSLKCLTPSKEFKDKMEDANVALQARLNSKFMRIVIPTIFESNTALPSLSFLIFFLGFVLSFSISTKTPFFSSINIPFWSKSIFALYLTSLPFLILYMST